MAGSGNFFSDTSIDRVSHLRKDPSWVEEQLNSPKTLIHPVWQTKNLVMRGDPPAVVLLPVEQVKHHFDKGALILLGVEEKDGTPVPVFCLDLSSIEELEVMDEFRRDGAFTELRQVGGLISGRDGSLCAYGRGMTHWHNQSNHCGVCGTKTRIVQAGHVRVCESSDCGKEIFPRSDPAVIMLVTNGDQALLGRGPTWPQGMFSTLAGFCEPGESLEMAVAREVHEETGIIIDEARYHSSQPWPFPQSLMLGFLATSSGGEPKVDGEEIAEARWFDRQDLRGLLERREVRLPPPLSIARQLIDSWLVD